ncbi:MAG: cyclic lactone autoinducer peptide [Eubacterium sp.]|nr:cyclic lactone autoinducer peptide [Eubacterium sp.]
MEKKKLSTILLKGAAKVLYKEAEKNANTACWIYNHQPALPEKVKSLRKF